MMNGDVTATVNPDATEFQGTIAPPTPLDFMLSVVPWPTNGLGHVNLHYSMVNPRAGEAASRCSKAWVGH